MLTFTGSAGYGSLVADITGGLHQEPFSGCIRDISINNLRSEQLTQYSNTGIQPCS